MSCDVLPERPRVELESVHVNCTVLDHSVRKAGFLG